MFIRLSLLLYESWYFIPSPNSKVCFMAISQKNKKNRNVGLMVERVDCLCL